MARWSKLLGLYACTVVAIGAAVRAAGMRRKAKPRAPAGGGHAGRAAGSGAVTGPGLRRLHRRGTFRCGIPAAGAEPIDACFWHASFFSLHAVLCGVASIKA